MATYPPSHIGSELTITDPDLGTSDGGGGGSGTVTSITATTPIVVTPNPITSTGDVSHAASGVSAGTYGDASHVPQVTVDAKGHVTAASQLAIAGGGTVTSITATAPIAVTPSPITGAGDVSHNNSGVTAATYGDGTHWPIIVVDAKGHITLASSQLLTIGPFWYFGNGADGAVHFDGVNTFSFASKSGNVYTLGRSIYCTDCTIDVGVTVQCFDWTNVSVGGGNQVFCTGTLTVNGNLNNNGTRNTINGNIGGLGACNLGGVAKIYDGGGNGGAGGGGGGGAGIVGASKLNSYGGAGGAGGNGNTGILGGAGGTVSHTNDRDSGGVNNLYFPHTMVSGRQTLGASPFWFQWGPGAGGGGGGNGTGSTGGGGGGGGGTLLVAAKTIASASGSITCNGGGGNSPSSGTPPGNGGGGGGGGGGVLIILTTTANFASVVTCTANGGAGGATGGAGANGANGSNGVVVAVVVSQFFG